jgi:demethylmacrocin O-methyltransferase
MVELATLHGTDKWGMHRYADHYEHHLHHLRNEDFALFEIGIGGTARAGASLRMWRDYFPRAQVIGLDIDDRSSVRSDRIHPYVGSQVDPKILDEIFADFPQIRVIVDDGSHRPEHIRESFALLFPRLPDEGIYIIEDTQTSYWPAWGGSADLNADFTTMALAKALIDGLNWEEWGPPGYQPAYTDVNVRAVHFYHNLVIVEKGQNREGTGRAQYEAGDPAEH